MPQTFAGHNPQGSPRFTLLLQEAMPCPSLLKKGWKGHGGGRFNRGTIYFDNPSEKRNIAKILGSLFCCYVQGLPVFLQLKAFYTCLRRATLKVVYRSTAGFPPHTMSDEKKGPASNNIQKPHFYHKEWISMNCWAHNATLGTEAATSPTSEDSKRMQTAY